MSVKPTMLSIHQRTELVTCAAAISISRKRFEH